jgi:hypothetical protein
MSSPSARYPARSPRDLGSLGGAPPDHHRRHLSSAERMPGRRRWSEPAGISVHPLPKNRKTGSVGRGRGTRYWRVSAGGLLFCYVLRRGPRPGRLLAPWGFRNSNAGAVAVWTYELPDILFFCSVAQVPRSARDSCAEHRTRRREDPIVCAQHRRGTARNALAGSEVPETMGIRSASGAIAVTKEA